MRTRFIPTVLASLAVGALLSGVLGGCTSLDARAGVGSIPAAEGPAVAAGQDVNVLNGTYQRGPLTAAAWRAAGMTEGDAADAEGTFTFQFRSGSFRMEGKPLVAGSQETIVCTGSYTVNGDRVTVTLRHGRGCGPGGEFFSAAFERTLTELTFSYVEAFVVRHRVMVEGSWSVAGCYYSNGWRCNGPLL